ncbi:MAG: hypothetical protein K8S25_04920 [Alphaproteobacteria bacterium]|nr:hypothetical protein [Alphaproteobacteria bacterium]
MPMKIVCIGLALLALQPAAATAAENWFIYQGAKASWGYDAAKLDRGPAKTNQITTIYANYYIDSDNYEGKPYQYIVTEIVFNCQARTAQTKMVALFDNDAKPVETLFGDTTKPADSVDTSDAVDAIGKILFGIGCDGKTPPKGAIPSGDLFGTLAKLKSVTK